MSMNQQDSGNSNSQKGNNHDSGFWGTGWSFPPTFNLANNQLSLVHKTENINQSINIILSTLQGERPMMPEYGSNMRSHLFKNIDAMIKGEIISTVKHSLLEHEPRITVNAVELTEVGGAEPVVQLLVQYTVRKTNSRHNHVMPFSMNEGRQLQSFSPMNPVT